MRTPTCTYTGVHTRAHARPRARRNAHAHANPHTCTRIHAHAHIHTHARTTTLFIFPFGVPIYESANAPLIAGGAAGDYQGGIFHRDALGFGLMRDISIETQRRARAIGTDVVASALYGVGTIYEGYGVSAVFDASI